jgi:hypothetical protein
MAPFPTGLTGSAANTARLTISLNVKLAEAWKSSAVGPSGLGPDHGSAIHRAAVSLFRRSQRQRQQGETVFIKSARTVKLALANGILVLKPYVPRTVSVIVFMYDD